MREGVYLNFFTFAERLVFIKQFIKYFGFLLIFLSCKKENSLDCFKSNGTSVTETRCPGTFSNVYVGGGKIETFISKGSEYKVEVIAGKHLIKNIVTKLFGCTLRIDNLNTCNFVRGYKKTIRINITLPYLNHATNDGVGTLKLDGDFSQDSLSVRASNSGDIHINGNYNTLKISTHGNGDCYISGKSLKLFIHMYGINNVDTENLLVSNYTFVESFSYGNCTVNATQLWQLDYKLHRSGNLYYIGNPTILNHCNNCGGTGKAIKK